MRKGFLSIILLLALAPAPVGARAKANTNASALSAYQDQSGMETIEIVESTPNDSKPEVSDNNAPHSAMDKSGKDFEEGWEGENVKWIRQEPDVFESDYGESKVARRMTQAEKNQNAAENDGWGGAITIIAMCIVLSALIVLSILFMLFGKVSEAILTARKKRAKAAAAHSPHDDHDLAPGEVIAAISLALSEYFAEGHDVEDTILTIQRMQKAYSPWNSKIYNLRQNHDHRRNPSTEINFNESKRIQI